MTCGKLRTNARYVRLVAHKCQPSSKDRAHHKHTTTTPHYISKHRPSVVLQNEKSSVCCGCSVVVVSVWCGVPSRWTKAGTCGRLRSSRPTSCDRGMKSARRGRQGGHRTEIETDELATIARAGTPAGLPVGSAGRRKLRAGRAGDAMSLRRRS